MPLRQKKYWIGALTVLVLVLAASVAVVTTKSTSFCLSCHEMAMYQTELEASPHAKDAQGKAIGCSQCHIPGTNIVRMLAGKLYLGTKDVWVHYTEGGYDLDRAAMQPMARRFVDDANCRACHEDLNRNAKNDGPISEEGKLAHANYQGTNGQSRSTCAGCHVNMAHLPPFDERIPRNAKFLSTIKEKRP